MKVYTNTYNFVLRRDEKSVMSISNVLILLWLTELFSAQASVASVSFNLDN